MTRCKACNAPIKWIRTERGKQMPVNAKPLWVIAALGKTIQAFVPHWATCPGAEGFRPKRDGAAQTPTASG